MRIETSRRHMVKDWHKKHTEARSIPDKIADGVAAFVGSWNFILLQSGLMVLWIAGNAYLLFHFDPFPFIFLNLFMSAEAAFSTPIIMMSQNRAGQRDRAKAEHDYQVNEAAKEEVETLLERLDEIEQKKLDSLLEKVDKIYDYTHTLHVDNRAEKRAAKRAQKESKKHGV